MRKFLIPTKDTSLYQSFPTNNAGLDEILEIGKLVDPALSNKQYDSASVRAILYFDTASAGTIPSGSQYFLNLRLANASDISRGQEIQISPVVSNWTEGSGYLYQDVQNVKDGASWTAAQKFVSWSTDGGDFASTNTQSVFLTEYPLQDIRVNITNVINYSGSSYGIMLKFPTSDEIDGTNEGNLKVFSSQTHTIHQPTLEIAWVDQVYVTGSLLPAPTDIAIVPQNIKETYVRGDVSRVDFVVRDPYPLRSYNSVLRYKPKYYLPSTTYYSITDIQANTVVVPFDEYSTVQCDTNGVYMLLDTSMLYRGRFYSVTLKVVSGSFTSHVKLEQSFRVL